MQLAVHNTETASPGPNEPDSAPGAEIASPGRLKILTCFIQHASRANSLIMCDDIRAATTPQPHASALLTSTRERRGGKRCKQLPDIGAAPTTACTPGAANRLHDPNYDPVKTPQGNHP